MTRDRARGALDEAPGSGLRHLREPDRGGDGDRRQRRGFGAGTSTHRMSARGVTRPWLAQRHVLASRRRRLPPLARYDETVLYAISRPLTPRAFRWRQESIDRALPAALWRSMSRGPCPAPPRASPERGPTPTAPPVPGRHAKLSRTSAGELHDARPCSGAGTFFLTRVTCDLDRRCALRSNLVRTKYQFLSRALHRGADRGRL